MLFEKRLNFHDLSILGESMGNFQLIGVGFIEIGAETVEKLRKEEKDSAQLVFFAKKGKIFVLKFSIFSCLMHLEYAKFHKESNGILGVKIRCDSEEKFAKTSHFGLY